MYISLKYVLYISTIPWCEQSTLHFLVATSFRYKDLILHPLDLLSLHNLPRRHGGRYRLLLILLALLGLLRRGQVRRLDGRRLNHQWTLLGA